MITRYSAINFNCYVNRDEVVNKYVLFKTTIHVLVIPSVRKIGISRPADGSAGADGPGGTDARQDRRPCRHTLAIDLKNLAKLTGGSSESTAGVC